MNNLERQIRDVIYFVFLWQSLKFLSIFFVICHAARKAKKIFGTKVTGFSKRLATYLSFLQIKRNNS